jgi:hypothetical protein
MPTEGKKSKMGWLKKKIWWIVGGVVVVVLVIWGISNSNKTS